MQGNAERAVSRGIEELKQRGKTDVQAALIALELNTGAIRAMVGGENFQDSQFNRAWQARRQPGSAFKPIVYLTALEAGYRPDDIISDEKVVYFRPGLIWSPQNYTEVYHGYVTLEQALASSFNSATVDLARQVKMKNIIKTAQKLGIKSPIRPYYSSALGASEVTLLELVYAYAALAHGNRIEPVFIDRIIDRENSSTILASGMKEPVIDQRIVSRMRQMLRKVITEGTGKKALALDREVFGKTGTTNDYADAWFVGFDDKYAVGVWVGRDNHAAIGEGETGSQAALPIWIEFMANI
jgi:penicillin-binding protein 1A